MIDSPYRGLEPYDEDSARYFFGRDRDVRLIAANMFGAPLTLLYGPSGVGKTSVLLAGVLPALNEREHCFTASHRTWRDDPLAGLRRALDEAAGEPVPLVELVRRRSAGGKRVMLVLDQFEEYFLYWPENGAFEVDLAEALTEPDLPLGVLVSIREDAVARLDRFEGRIPQLFDNILRIANLDRAGAVEAIEKPIARFNEDHPDEKVELDQGLADAVLAGMQVLRPAVAASGGAGDDSVVVTESFETPWLQLMMLELWRELDGPGGRRLGPETLKGLGSVTEVVDRHVEAALGALSERDQDVAARIFAYLVTPSGSKIAHTSSDLAVYSEIPQRQLRGVLTELAGEARILRTVPPPPDQPRESAYEIYHDVLGRAILAWGARHAGRRRAEQERERRTPRGGEGVREADAVFAAGGIKMLGLAGALLGFAEHPTKPVRNWVEVAGSGGGALVASLLATGRDAAMITEILRRTNFGAFADADHPLLGRLIPRPLRRGYANGDRFRLWLDALLDEATFAKVKRPDTGYRLRVIAADVTHGRMLLLPDDLPLYRLPGEKQPIDPDSFPIASAVRMSMSIPYYFEPVELVSVETGLRATILDGGLFAELPIWIFDSPGLLRRPTFGFRVVGRQGGDPEEVRQRRRLPPSGRLGYDIFRMTSDSFDARFVTSTARGRTCVIDAGSVGTTQFDLTAAATDILVQAGRSAAASYLDRFDIDNYSNSYRRTVSEPESPESA